MKRTFAKRSIMSLVAGFFLFGFMLLSAVRVEAQSNWVSPDEAKVRLEQAIKDQHVIMSGSQQGQPPYDNALVIVVYYKSVYRLISDGVSVQQAVSQGLGTLTTSVDPNVGIAPGQFVAQSSPQGAVYDLTGGITDLLTD